MWALNTVLPAPARVPPGSCRIRQSGRRAQRATASSPGSVFSAGSVFAALALGSTAGGLRPSRAGAAERRGKMAWPMRLAARRRRHSSALP